MVPDMKTQPMASPKTVVITGCSSGIGATAACWMRDRGWTVWPTARSEKDLARLTEQGFEPVALDVANEASVAEAAACILERCGGTLGGLVNNAGFAQPGAVEDLTRDLLRYQFEVNVFGMQQLTNALLPALRNGGGGRIVQISSIYSLMSVPVVGAYCASKYAMEALADALRIELRGTGVYVSLIEPGAIITEFRRNAVSAGESAAYASSRFTSAYAKELARRKKQQQKPNFIKRPPEDVAKKIQHALESARPRSRYRVTPPAHIAAFLKRLLPTHAFDPLLFKQLEKTL